MKRISAAIRYAAPTLLVSLVISFYLLTAKVATASCGSVDTGTVNWTHGNSPSTPTRRLSATRSTPHTNWS